MAMGHATTQDRPLRSVLAALLTCLLASTGGASARAQVLPPRNLAPPVGSPIQRLIPPVLPSATPGAEVPLLPPAGAEVPNRPVRVVSTELEGVTAFK